MSEITESKKENKRNKILDAARKIVDEQGIEQLSIRKITKTLDYSLGIVYHYFKDKDEILETLLKEGYEKILLSLREGNISANNPAEEIRLGFNHYISTVLTFKREYKAFILSERPEILEHTRILYKGIHKVRPTMAKLCDSLQKGVSEGFFAINDIELTAQAMWVSINGLALRLIIEDVEDDFKDRLVNEQLNLLLKGIAA